MLNLKLGGSLALAVGLCACAHAPRPDARPAAFEARWLWSAGTVSLDTDTQRQVNEFDLGKFLVVETNDVYLPEGTASFIIDGETILTESEEKIKYLQDFLKAAYPNLLGGPTAFPAALPVGVPYFTTLDAYISGLKESQESRREVWAREQPGEQFPGRDYDQLRAELQKKLEGRDALILRYVNAKKAEPRP